MRPFPRTKNSGHDAAMATWHHHLTQSKEAVDALDEVIRYYAFEQIFTPSQRELIAKARDLLKYSSIPMSILTKDFLTENGDIDFKALRDTPAMKHVQSSFKKEVRSLLRKK